MRKRTHDPGEKKKMIEADFFKEVEVADVEQVEGTGNIDNPLAGLGAFAVGKLEGDSSLNIIPSSVSKARSLCRKPGGVFVWSAETVRRRSKEIGQTSRSSFRSCDFDPPDRL